MRASRALSALVCSWLLAAGQAAAIAPAGGPPGPFEAETLESGSSDSPDASVEDRSWLRQSSGPASNVADGSDSHSPLLTLLALLLVAGLGGGAVWLQRKKRTLSPIAGADARLTLLSSTRVGPKAYAVSAEVSGRVLLLGVTDHSVTHLAWLDPPEPELPEELSSPEPEAVDEQDDLPDDYPGSSLRAPSQNLGSLRPSALTTSQNLRRFQEVLRGAVPLTSQAGRAPRAAVRDSEPLVRGSVSTAPDAATTLAALTSDVVRAEPAPTTRSVPPASLRRKRQRRELDPKPTRAAPKAAPSAPATSALEGQVAGLRALKNG
ncbi:MAG TPA: flagellar biosynthetic protein FliO [Polyangiaceae bacterium]|nr:flagellar biosynthetic protein FliO [Polyangiaceae bacterium]